MEYFYFALGLVLLVGAYSLGYSQGMYTGFCAREYHNPVVVVASTHQDTYLGHDFTDHGFVGQADTVEELVEIVKTKYPDKTVILAESTA